MIVAKPVVSNKFWILKQDDIKIGEVEANSHGYTVTINNTTVDFKTIKTLKNQTRIEFEEPVKKKKVAPENSVNGFSTNATPHNAVYDVQKRLPLFTKKKDSKSWYAAGYYRLNLDGAWVTMHCPKLILLQRYEYLGPVYTPSEFTFA